ncbi:MAG: hypothetical protein WAV90_19475 [Gordonia amarae]
MAKHAVRKWIAGALVGAAAMSGVVVGAGSAEAKIDSGWYTIQWYEYGILPMPKQPAKVVGNTLIGNPTGFLPWDMSRMKIRPTRFGGVASSAPDPVSEWTLRIDFKKTPYGYKGMLFEFGVIVGDVYLRKVHKKH